MDEDSLKSVYCSPETIIKVINDSKDSLSQGPDGIPARVYKVAGDILAHPLSMIFNVSMSSGEVPRDWKEALIKPILKKGSRAKASNYRPISLTCVASRLMERCLKREIMDHLVGNELLNSHQHGFRTKKSTLSNLLEYSEAITEAVDMGLKVDAVYMDFQKAFDKVPHKRLLVKIIMGIKGALLTWIKDWLSNRKQRVVVMNKMSEWTLVTSSVVQGSVLGPLLFLIYIDDLCYVVESMKSLFADDTKVFRVIKSGEDHRILQKDLNSLMDWARKWQMEFNPTKCHAIRFGQGPTPGYTIGGDLLEDSTCEKDVGVMVSSNLKFQEQAASAIASANKVLGLIKRSFQSRDMATMVSAYTTYARPHLEYCSQVWTPGTKHWQDKLERVQKRALRLIPSLQGLSYEEKLRRSGLLSLENRHLLLDLTEVYKIMNQSNYSSLPLNVKASERTTRSTSENLLGVPRCRLDIRKNFFTIRAAKEWNQIPREIRELSGLTSFKKQLKQYLFDLQSQSQN